MAVHVQKQIANVEKQIGKIKDQLADKTEPVLTPAEVEAVDVLVELRPKIEEAKKNVKAYEAARKLLVEMTLDPKRGFPGDKMALLKGEKGFVEFSERGEVRVIKDKDGLIQKLKEKVGGYEKLIPIININLGDIDKVLALSEQAGLIVKEPGSRTVKSVVEYEKAKK